MGGREEKRWREEKGKSDLFGDKMINFKLLEIKQLISNLFAVAKRYAV